MAKTTTRTKADPCGMTNKRTNNGKGRSKGKLVAVVGGVSDTLRYTFWR
jgi:hypothetical protein